MKKLFAIVLAALCLMMGILPAYASGSTTMYVDTPAHGTLTLREKESTSSKAVMRIPYKAKVSVKENRGTWSLVEYDGLKGFVLTRYLSKKRPTGEAAEVDPVDTKINYRSFKLVESPYIVTAKASRPGGYVNMRWAPDTEIAIQEKIYDGEEVLVISEGNGWCQVQDPVTGAVGFMMTRFLQK